MGIKRALRGFTSGFAGKTKENITFKNHKEEYFSTRYVNKNGAEKIDMIAKLFDLTKKDALAWMIDYSYQGIMQTLIKQDLAAIKNEREFGLKPLPNPPLEKLRKMAYETGIKTEIKKKNSSN